MFTKSVMAISFVATTFIGPQVVIPKEETTTMLHQHIETNVKPIKEVLPDREAVSPEDVYRWNKVAWCESHANWSQVRYGSHSFSGALGIRNDVWIEYGGSKYGPTAGHATPIEQIRIAKRINGGGFVPDQDGTCSAW